MTRERAGGAPACPKRKSAAAPRHGAFCLHAATGVAARSLVGFLFVLFASLALRRTIAAPARTAGAHFGKFLRLIGREDRIDGLLVFLARRAGLFHPLLA